MSLKLSAATLIRWQSKSSRDIDAKRTRELDGDPHHYRGQNGT